MCCGPRVRLPGGRCGAAGGEAHTPRFLLKAALQMGTPGQAAALFPRLLPAEIDARAAGAARKLDVPGSSAAAAQYAEREGFFMDIKLLAEDGALPPGGWWAAAECHHRRSWQCGERVLPRQHIITPLGRGAVPVRLLAHGLCKWPCCLPA